MYSYIMPVADPRGERPGRHLPPPLEEAVSVLKIFFAQNMYSNGLVEVRGVLGWFAAFQRAARRLC